MSKLLPKTKNCPNCEEKDAMTLLELSRVENSDFRVQYICESCGTEGPVRVALLSVQPNADRRFRVFPTEKPIVETERQKAWRVIVEARRGSGR